MTYLPSPFRDTNSNMWVISYDKSYVIHQNGRVVQFQRDPPTSFLTGTTIDNQILLGATAPGLFTAEVVDDKITTRRVTGTYPQGLYTYLKGLSNSNLFASYNLSNISILHFSDSLSEIHNFDFQGMVHTSHQTSDSIIVGTDQGLYVINLSNSTIKKLSWAHCVSNLNVYGVIPVADTALWLSTNHGIHMIDLKRKACRSYTESYGLSDTQFNPGAYAKMKNGDIWFGSQNGITIFNPKDIVDPEIKANVNISEVLINDEETDKIKYQYIFNHGESYNNHYILKHLDNTISFSFASLDYRGIGKAEYKYRLLPIDDTWVDNGNRGFVRFSNLSPGFYTLQVRNTGYDPYTDTDDGPIKEVYIEIIPPFYLTTWFILLSSLVILGSAITVISRIQRRKRDRIKLLYENRLALENERMRIANDLHDDLGSSLSALSLKAQFLSDQSSDKEAKGLLRQLAETSNQLTQRVRETIWVINADHDSIDALITRIAQFAEEYFRNTNVNCTISLPENQISAKIDGRDRRHIFLTCKEIFHNIHKHAEASQIKIDIHIQKPSTLVITIADNGIGFDPEHHRDQGHGLTSMRNRIAQAGGQFQLKSGREGTNISIIYPIIQS